MFFKFLKDRWQKITALVLLILIALVLIVALVINLYWSPILSSKVKEVVLKSSDSLYKVDFSSAELHILRGTIVIYNINLKPDTAIFNRRFKQHLAPNNLVELHIKRLTLSHIHPFRLYFHHKLDIGEISVKEPEINIRYQLNHSRDTAAKNNKTAWEKISKSLRSIHIGMILLGDVKLKYEDYSGNKLMVSELKEMNLSASDLLIDSATQTDKSRLLYCKEIIAELNNYSSKSPNGLYTYGFSHLKLSTRTSQLNIEGLTLKPIALAAFFAKSTKDKFTVRLDSLQLNNFDFLTYHKYRVLDGSHLILKKGYIQVYGSIHHPAEKTDKIKSFPNVGIFQIKGDLKIDTISIHHINVYYSEYNEKSRQTGTVSFDNTSGRFLNITTDSAALKKNDIVSVNLTTYFMNRARLETALTFKLADKNAAYSYKGTLGPMDLQYANSALMPLALVKATSGSLKQLTFDIHADRQRASGKVSVLYNNLKVGVLKVDTTFNGLTKRPIATLFANVFILKHDNPDNAGVAPRVANVTFYRPMEMPFFKFTWQTLLSGIKPCVGLDKQTEDSIVAMRNQSAINKANRKIKKEERIKRREERRARKAAEARGQS